MTKEVEQLKGRVLLLETSLVELIKVVKEINKNLESIKKATLEITRIFRE